MRRRPFSDILILLVLLALPSLLRAQETKDYRIFTITFNTSSPSDLAIDRGRLAWIDNDISTGLHFVKYYSGADITVLDSNLTAVTLAISGDEVVWNSQGELAKAYDLRNGVSLTLGESYNPDGIQPIGVHNGVAVYAARNAGSGTRVIVHRFADGSDTSLSEAPWNTEPSIHQGEIAWVGADSEGAVASSDIYLFDGRSVSKISGTSRARNRGPIVRDGQVAWLQIDSGLVRVKEYTGDTLITVGESQGATDLVTGYDLSDGIAIAAFTDTVTSAGTIHIYDAEHHTSATIADSNGVWSPHISNGLVVWQSGTGVDRRLHTSTIQSATVEDVAGAENPVVDHGMIAWTYGDAVELRRFVNYRQLTNDGMNGWEQTKFKTIDSNRVIWGNFANAIHMRMFAWDGNAVTQLSDSVGTRDLVIANDGYAVWRLDADSLFYSDWVHPPVKFLDTVQAENPYTAGGFISFFGLRLNVNDQVKYPWLYDIQGDHLIQLSTDSSNAGNVYCDGKNACWEDLTTEQLLFFDGTTTTTISDSAIVGDYAY
ncbi:MAG: hypothetical protein WB699_13520, partial [Bacteroidota bacterium]